MADHYVPMEAINRNKRRQQTKRTQLSAVDEVFADADSFVSSDEDNNVEDTPSSSGASLSEHSANSSGALAREEQPYELFMPETRKVVLHPGAGGLGMSVAGGVSSSLGLLPVFITDIDPEGAADQCNGLKVGDRIISVNGEDMAEKSHRDVVLAIKAAGENLVLDVTQGPENILNYVSFE